MYVKINEFVKEPMLIRLAESGLLICDGDLNEKNGDFFVIIQPAGTENWTIRLSSKLGRTLKGRDEKLRKSKISN